MPEKFSLYVYRTSLGDKHGGVEKTGVAAVVMVDAARMAGMDQDVCEIRITDTSDFMVFHWTAAEGLQFPDIKQMSAEAQQFWQARGKPMSGFICVTCRQPVAEFKNELSRKEFAISGMCQKCQDSVWGGN